MRRSYGGVVVDLGSVVYAFDVWAATPIFHRCYADGGLPGTTACGLALYGRLVADATALPPKHAARIGRPCARCWPELRRQLAIPRDHVRQGDQMRLP